MKNLYQGDRGILVSYMQLALKRAGYTLLVDGIFGTNTCQALADFLQTDRICVVDRSAWEKLLPYLRGYVTEEGENRILFEDPVTAVEVPYTSLLTAAVIDGLRVRYPFLKSGEIGKSVMGKDIHSLWIGTGEKQVFYSASYHANESITTPVLLTFAEEYAAAYAAGGNIAFSSAAREENDGQTGMGQESVDARTLFDEFRLCMVPLVNPDGVDLVNGLLNSGVYYRRAKRIADDYPSIPFPDGWKANIDGVDLNLQFPAGWEIAKQIKFSQGYDKPAPRDYVGKAPLTAPESVAVYELTKENDFLLILAYHTQGEVIYWKYLDYEPARSKEIADYFGSVSGYAVEETPGASGYAGYKDWFIEEYDRSGYTVEAGMGENPLPMTQFERIYHDNKGILVGGMTQLR